MPKLLNNVEISGYVATEPKAFGNDNNVGRMRIRHDRSRKVQDEWKKESSFFSVVVFGDDVDRLLELQKGDKVLVIGRLQQNQKEDTKQEFVDIIASEFAFIPTEPIQPPPKASKSKTSQEAQDFLDVS